ncbi:uncharacterized protein KIAA1958 homolog [Tyto alba]|uniref:uncharacterized protein KIAA1958 homolog n=1 Tax=Tyto alba TaxID=56313 RepID=UPI001401C982|nr:uncharacterized protein KIAA1958 homolog [Tyto alba]XP_042643642.1 uncharacterized protein KIAA1958 homolog [Tyto alba]
MEDCLHTSCEDLSKLVSWAHSHGTICNLIPSLKHLFSEGSQGNLTVTWRCSAGHAYYWPLAATCHSRSLERICFQESHSLSWGRPRVLDVASEQSTSLEYYSSQAGQGKLDDNHAGSSSNIGVSGPSEVRETVEEDEGNDFEVAGESSATEEDSDLELCLKEQLTGRHKRQASCLSAATQEQSSNEGSSREFKRIKQEVPEDCYVVANVELTAGAEGPALSLTHMSKPSLPRESQTPCLEPARAMLLPPTSSESDLQPFSTSTPSLSLLASQKLPQSLLASLAQGTEVSPVAALQVPATSSSSTVASGKSISIPLSALQLPGQEESMVAEETVPPTPQVSLAGDVSSSPLLSTEPEVSSSQQQPHAATTPEVAEPVIPDQDERTAELSREQNEKTIRSTQTALRNFREFLISKYPSETREIYVIPCKELDAYLASFFVDARQKDGSEYEPNSLANYQCGLERYLKEHRYGYSITRDKEFKRSQEALKQKQIELRCKGKGNKPHKSMKLTFADELILRKRGLLSRYNPEGLLNLVWLNNTKAFGHCTGFHGSTLKWGDIRLRVTETGLEYLEWMGPDNGDANAKSKRGGTDSRVYATQHSPQTCPVQDYKEYAQRRPPAMRYEDAPFYLSIKPVVNLAALHWYNCQALGKNKLAKMVKTMCEKGNIPGRKTNFSVYQSCSTLSEAQSNQLVLICNNLSQQAAQSMASRSSTGNFIVSASYDSSSDTA